MIHPPVLCEYIPSPRTKTANTVKRTGYRTRFRIVLRAVERTRENPAIPTASSSCALTLSGIAPSRDPKTRETIRTHFGAVRTGDASTDASTVSKSESSSPGKRFSPTGPGSAPMSLGRFIIASPAAAAGAATVGAGAAGLGGGAAAGAGLAAGAAAAAPFTFASALTVAAAPGVSAPPAVFPHLAGTASAKVVS